MNRIFLLLAVLCLFLEPPGTAQAAPGGFLGVPWGSSQAVIDKLLEDKGFARLEEGLDDDSRYYRGKVAGDEYLLLFMLKNDALYAVATQFIGTDAVVENRQRRLERWLRDEYGNPEDSYAHDGKTGYPGNGLCWGSGDYLLKSDRTVIKLDVTRAVRNPFATLYLYAENFRYKY